MSNEVFTNDSSGVVTSGGTTNPPPASGHPETWTVNVTQAFPSSGGPQLFHVADQANQQEKILVTVGSSGTGSQTWTVIRGAEGTTPVVHQSGFVVQQVITAGWLNSALAGLAPSNDTSGATDTANITGLLNLGGYSLLQPGTFYTDATITVPSGARLSGAGTGQTIIQPQKNYGHVLLLAPGNYYGGVANLTIRYTGIDEYYSTLTPSTYAGIAFSITTQAAYTANGPYAFTMGCRLENLEITGMGVGIFWPWTNGTSIFFSQYYQCVVRDVRLHACNLALFLSGFSDCDFYNIELGNIFGMNPASLQATVIPASGTTASNTYATVSQCLLNDQGNSHVRKLEVYGGQGDAVVFQESVTTHVWGLEAGSLGHATVASNGLVLYGCGTEFQVDGAHIALLPGHGIYLTNTNITVTGNVLIANSRVDTVGKHGIYADGSNPRVTIIGCTVEGSSNPNTTWCLGTPNTCDGINFTGGDLKIIGGTFGDFGSPTSQRYGINMSSSGDNTLAVYGVNLLGNKSGPIAWIGTRIDVRGCYGLNWGGWLTAINTPGIPNIGQANAVLNGNPYPVRVYQSGQSGTSIIDLNARSVTLPGETPWVELQPGEKIWYANTKPSSWDWYGL